jgi:hypothetical protein
MSHRVLGSWRASAGALSALVALLVASSCGNTAAPTSASPTSAPSSSAGPTNYRFLNPALFPEQDTPLAQASAQLQQVWTPYDVTVIPGRHVLDNMPEPPRVINMTNGKLSDADAQALAWAEYRENAFLGWLELHKQPGLNNHLRSAGLFTGVIGNAVRAGKSVTNPPCGLYAQEIAVVPVDATITQFESGKGYPVTSSFALVDKYTAPCTVAVTGGTALFSASSPVVIVETGAARHDDVLGYLFFAESGRDCQLNAAIAACGDVK